MRPSPIPAAPLRTLPEEPPHPCLRCGLPVAAGDSLCERCNPLGLPQPAATQAHGTILLAIGLSVAALALVAHLAVGGVGPFSGSVTGVTARPAGLQVAIAVHNDGTSAGDSTCRVFDPTEPGIGPDAGFLLSPPVPPGGTITFSGLVTSLGAAVRPLAVDCR